MFSAGHRLVHVLYCIRVKHDCMYCTPSLCLFPYSDEGVCFPIQKGLIASRSKVKYFKHNDMEDLERLLEEQKRLDIKVPGKKYIYFYFVNTTYMYMYIQSCTYSHVHLHMYPNAWVHQRCCLWFKSHRTQQGGMVPPIARRQTNVSQGVSRGHSPGDTFVCSSALTLATSTWARALKSHPPYLPQQYKCQGSSEGSHGTTTWPAHIDHKPYEYHCHHAFIMYQIVITMSTEDKSVALQNTDA